VANADEEATPAPDGGYFCPYCAVQGPADAWWTKAQLEAAQAQGYRDVLKPEIEKRFRGRAEVSEPQMPQPLTEADDMRRVEFPCHDEPVKVLDDWQGPVHCPMCATVSNPPSSPA
jgi:hypothetical protein